MTFKSAFLALLMCASLCASFVPELARAQGPQGMVAPPPLPLAVDLKKVPVGSWSEYRVADGQNTVSIRMALVARSAGAADVETQIKGGPIAALGSTTVRLSLPLRASAEIKPLEQVVQLGDNPPMLLPVEMAGQRGQMFKKLDPKKRIGVDSVTVPAGAFPHADHYRETGAGGETIDFWISKNVMPFGLVKVSSTAAGSGSGVSMELTGHGGGAKPAITKPPQPFDAAAIMKQAQPALSGGDSAAKGGPPPRPIPSPHPGMPPTAAGPPPGSAATKNSQSGRGLPSTGPSHPGHLGKSGMGGRSAKDHK